MEGFSNQGLLGIAFFEATAFFILLVLFFLLNRDLPARFFRLWTVGWAVLSVASGLEVLCLLSNNTNVRLLLVGSHMASIPLFLLRFACDHVRGVALGIAMVVLVLETARSRTEDLNEKLRRLTLITTASTQSFNVNDVLEPVLTHLVESLSASHGLIRMTDGAGESATLALRASVGFSEAFCKKYANVSVQESWVRRVLTQECSFLTLEAEQDPKVREKMAQDGIAAMVLVPLPGKEGPLGVLAIGLSTRTRFEQDEVNFIMNVANLLGLTVQNVTLFEKAATVQKQWAYTFDSIQDPILVHDCAGKILRANRRLAALLDRDIKSLTGRPVAEVLDRKGHSWSVCPYCEGAAGEGDDPDPWFNGFFLASNSDL